MVRAIGADHVVDYTQEDFTQRTQRYDLIVDNVGSHSLAEYRRVLTPRGALVMVGGSSEEPFLGPMWRSIRAKLLSPFVPQKLIFILAKLNQADIDLLSNWMSAGMLTPVIDKRYPLTETAEAIRYLEQGHARGKVIISVE